jgi:hypothetical protein
VILGQGEDEDYLEINTKNKHYECEEWIQHEHQKFSASLNSMLLKRHLPIYLYQYSGKQAIELCELSIWTNRMSPEDMDTSLDETTCKTKRLAPANIPIPTANMSPKSYGIMYWLMENESKRGMLPEVQTLYVISPWIDLWSTQQLVDEDS